VIFYLLLRYSLTLLAQNGIWFFPKCPLYHVRTLYPGLTVYYSSLFWLSFPYISTMDLNSNLYLLGARSKFRIENQFGGRKKKEILTENLTVFGPFLPLSDKWDSAVAVWAVIIALIAQKNDLQRSILEEKSLLFFSFFGKIDGKQKKSKLRKKWFDLWHIFLANTVKVK